MKHLLSSTAFLVVNKLLAKGLGLNSAVLLADLISKESYFIDNGMIQDGWFFNTQANISNDTTLTPYQQRNALIRLKDCGIVECEVRGIPAKTYYRISEAQVIKFLNNKSETNLRTINKNKSIKKINNINIEVREINFRNQVSLLDYPLDLQKAFCDYWTESNKSNTKMKFELQKTFDIGRRLVRWKQNTNKWNKPTSMSKIDSQINEYMKGKELL